MSELENIISGQDSISQAGIKMEAEPLGKRKLKWQVITLQIPFDVEEIKETVTKEVQGTDEEGNPTTTTETEEKVTGHRIINYRKPFETTSHKTNERIVGITLHSDFEDALNESTIQLSIDNEEILPEEFDCSLIAAKKDVGFYKNMYRLNERANGSLLKGTYIGNALLPDVEAWLESHPNALRGKNPNEYFYTVKIYLWCIQKPLALNNKGL